MLKVPVSTAVALADTLTSHAGWQALCERADGDPGEATRTANEALRSALFHQSIDFASPGPTHTSDGGPNERRSQPSKTTATRSMQLHEGPGALARWVTGDLERQMCRPPVRSSLATAEAWELPRAVF